LFGLLERDLKYIKLAASKYKEIDKIVIYGSRAMGNHKQGSDVDIALMGEKTNQETVRRLYDDLNEEYPLPYFFDVVDYKEISNENLKKHIMEEGKLLYERE
jgi:predicted nucleotidyltransferase